MGQSEDSHAVLRSTHVVPKVSLRRLWELCGPGYQGMSPANVIHLTVVYFGYRTILDVISIAVVYFGYSTLLDVVYFVYSTILRLHRGMTPSQCKSLESVF